jgi:hypothetical protein
LLSAGVPNSDRGVDQSNSELFCERIWSFFRDSLSGRKRLFFTIF